MPLDLKFALPLILLCCLSCHASSQCLVTGSVVDARHAPVAGANIIIQNTMHVTVADKEGNFTLAAPCDSVTLIVRFNGYQGIDQRLLPEANALPLQIILVKSSKKKKKSSIHQRKQTPE